MVIINQKRVLLKDDPMIEELLKGKFIGCNGKKGIVINFFNNEITEVKERKITGMILDDGSEITFTDDLEITILK